MSHDLSGGSHDDTGLSGDVWECSYIALMEGLWKGSRDETTSHDLGEWSHGMTGLAHDLGAMSHDLGEVSHAIITSSHGIGLSSNPEWLDGFGMKKLFETTCRMH